MYNHQVTSNTAPNSLHPPEFIATSESCDIAKNISRPNTFQAPHPTFYNVSFSFATYNEDSPSCTYLTW